MQAFLNKIKGADLLVVLWQNNGITVLLSKNVFDWCTRIKVFSRKPMLLLATSPGARGGASVLKLLKMLSKIWSISKSNTFR
jgi:NAD(P)H-dependent FMN reductase